MNALYAHATVASLSDEVVIEEAAKRLQAAFTRDNQKPFLFGSFRFIFHEGCFQSVEDWPRNRRYRSQTKKRAQKVCEAAK